jgi:hypothetical protein
MKEKPVGSAEPSSRERDLRKRNLKSGNRDTIKLASEATAELWGGVAEAFAVAFRSFADELNTNTVTTVGLSNGFVAGTAAAHAGFLAELSKTSERVYETVKSAEDSVLIKEEPIDYDRLAKLVAVEISRMQEVDKAKTHPK